MIIDVVGRAERKGGDALVIERGVVGRTFFTELPYQFEVVVVGERGEQGRCFVSGAQPADA